MKKVLIAWLLLVALLASAAACDDPGSNPMDPESVELTVGAEWADSTGTMDSLLVAQERIRKAYLREDQWRIQQLWSFGGGSALQIELRNPDGSHDLTMSIREPGNSIHDPLTCHEGYEQGGGVTPIGTCEYYNSHWTWVIELVMSKMIGGELARWEVYEHPTGWTQFYLTWGPKDPVTGEPWRFFLAMPQPQNPYIWLDPVPYLRPPGRIIRHFTNETGRGEQ